MAFGNKQPIIQVSAGRLAALAGGAGVAEAAAAGAGSPSGAPRRRVSVEPDLSRIRKRTTDETPEEHRRRLAAKTVNFSATIMARIIILGAAGLWLWESYEFSGQIHRGVALGMMAMLADLGRVGLKAMEPGSK